MGSAKGSTWMKLLAVTIARLVKPAGGRGRHAIVGCIAVSVLILAAYFAWRKWGPEFTNHERFVLSPDKIEVTPQPAWIHADVKGEVFRDGSLKKLKILDEQVAVKVASAFTLHNWVASVKRVSKHPGPRIVVDLEYRQPVAMVEVTQNGERGLLPIDVSGVLLPTEDFSPKETRNYLRISADNTAPVGLVGTAWGDERIAAAARLASLLGSAWQPLGVYRIAVSSDREEARRRADLVLELQSRKGSRVVWGKPPGQESSGEASASQKLARLAKYVQENGPLDSSGVVVKIDLRDDKPHASGPSAAGARPSKVRGTSPEAAVPGRRLVPVQP